MDLQRSRVVFVSETGTGWFSRFSRHAFHSGLSPAGSGQDSCDVKYVRIPIRSSMSLEFILVKCYLATYDSVLEPIIPVQLEDILRRLCRVATYKSKIGEFVRSEKYGILMPNGFLASLDGVD